MGLAATNINYAGLTVSATNRFPVEVGAPSSAATAGATSTVSFTRPENTTAYTAGDVIGIADAGTPANAGSAIHTFTSVGQAGGNIVITGVDLTIGLAAVTSGMSNFRLHLYNASPTAILDNAAFDLVSGDITKHVGYIDLATPVDYGSQLYTSSLNVNLQVKLATSVSSLYGELVTVGAYTPASATVYQIRLRTLAV